MTVEINPIEAVQSIVLKMQEIETKYLEVNKRMTELNEKQNDLVHALELNLSEEEVVAVAKALKALRKERREVKNLLINLVEAKQFVGANCKFVSEGSELVKRMQRIDKKALTRKYHVRHSEAILEVLDVTKHTERFVVDEACKQVATKEKEEKVVVEEKELSAVERFHKKWGFKE